MLGPTDILLSAAGTGPVKTHVILASYGECWVKLRENEKDRNWLKTGYNKSKRERKRERIMVMKKRKGQSRCMRENGNANEKNYLHF